MRRIDLTKAQAARSSTIRDLNRQFVLNYIRDREPISRAEIARSTELQRSTVSTIVEELKDEGLIEEIGAGASTGGRRPTLLRLRAAGATAIGVDITPSATTIAASDLVGRVIARERFENSPRPEELAAQVIERLRDIAGRQHQGTIAGVGVSLPGLVDTGTGRAIYIPFFRWRDWSIAEEIERATGLKALVDNDANAAALAELWFGRPEVSGARDFILALVAEGIGTGIVFDGQIYRGERGAAGEFGHMIVGQDAPVACSCGNRDCWEAFASERAAVARYASNSGHDAPSAFQRGRRARARRRAGGHRRADRDGALSRHRHLEPHRRALARDGRRRRPDNARVAHHRALARRDHPAQHPPRPPLRPHRRLDPLRADAHGLAQPRPREQVRAGRSLAV